MNVKRGVEMAHGRGDLPLEPYEAVALVEGTDEADWWKDHEGRK